MLYLSSWPLYHNRKAAEYAHPDKGGSEAKMVLVNEAYEVFSNPQLCARFDNGEDPMDLSCRAISWLVPNIGGVFDEVISDHIQSLVG